MMKPVINQIKTVTHTYKMPYMYVYLTIENDIFKSLEIRSTGLEKYLFKDHIFITNIHVINDLWKVMKALNDTFNFDVE